MAKGLTDILLQTPTKTPKLHLGASKLSDDQKQTLYVLILTFLKTRESLIEWDWQKGEIYPRSVQASVSRSLRRLEERGLLDRLNMAGDGNRTTHVQLTEAGMRVAGVIMEEREREYKTVNK